MLPFIRKFGKVFRGGVHPLEVGVSVALGVMAGVALGQNGLAVVFFLLLLVFNTNKAAMSLVGVPFAAAGITLTQYKFMIGRWTLSQGSLARLFEALANAPVGALLGFNRYTVVGGFVAGIPFAILCGFVAMMLTKKFRTAALALVGDEEAFKGWMGGKIVRLGKWILFGVGDADYEASLSRKPRPIRWSGLIILGIFSLLVGLASLLDYGWAVEDALEKQLTRAVGAQVDIGDFSLRPLAASARMVDLAVTNRTDPTRNSFEAKTVAADVSLTGLLQRSLIAEEISLSRFETDTKRETPGKVVADVDTDAVGAPDEKVPEPAKDSEPVSAYLSQWNAWKDRLVKIKDVLRKIEDSRNRSVEESKSYEVEDKRDFEALAKKYGYESITASEIRRTVPDLAVQKLVAEDIRTTYDHFSAVDLEIHNLVYPMRLSPGPTKLTVIDKKGKASLELIIDFRDPKSPAEFTLVMSEVPARGLNSELGSKVPITLEKGTVELKGNGTMYSDNMDVKLYIDLTNAEMKPKKNSSIGGLRDENLEWALKNMPDPELWVVLSGDPSNPRVKVESGAMIESLKKTLADAVKKKALEEAEKKKKEIERELERLKKKAKLDKILKEAAEKDGKSVTKEEAAEDIKKKAEEAKEDVEDEAKKKAKEALNNIFK